MLELMDVTVVRQGRTLFEPLSLTVEAGQVATLMGPSGIGKSSLLEALVMPSDGLCLSGEIRMDGLRMPLHRALLGHVRTVFQEPMLFPHLSVRGNIALSVAAWPKRDQAAAIDAVLARLELPGLADADPMALSRGQQMRVALARALIGKPRILLLDEPFSALDAATRERVKTWVYDTISAESMMAMLVTHQAEDRPKEGVTVCLTPHSSVD